MSHQAPVATQPRQRALNNPAPPHDFEASILIGAFDDLDGDVLARESGIEFAARIAAVGEDVRYEWKRSPRRADEMESAIAILHACRKNFDTEQEAYRVDDDITLDAFRLLAGVISDWVRAAPPFSVAFTACVSMIAAVGEAARPSCSRHNTRSV